MRGIWSLLDGITNFQKTSDQLVQYRLPGLPGVQAVPQKMRAVFLAAAIGAMCVSKWSAEMCCASSTESSSEAVAPTMFAPGMPE